MPKMKDIVFLWGWLADKSTYKKLRESCPKEYKIYEFSYHTEIPSGKLDNFEAKLLQFIRKNKLKSFYLLGHSMGGALAINFALKHPQGISKLILVDSEGIYEPQAPWQLVGNLVKPLLGKLEIKLLLICLLRILRKPFFHIRLGKFAHKVDLSLYLTQINIPTLIIWGDQDFLTPLSQGQKMNKLIKNSRLVMLKGMNHEWLINHPKLFWKNL